MKTKTLDSEELCGAEGSKFQFGAQSTRRRSSWHSAVFSSVCTYRTLIFEPSAPLSGGRCPLAEPLEVRISTGKWYFFSAQP